MDPILRESGYNSVENMITYVEEVRNSGRSFSKNEYESIYKCLISREMEIRRNTKNLSELLEKFDIAISEKNTANRESASNEFYFAAIEKCREIMDFVEQFQFIYKKLPEGKYRDSFLFLKFSVDNLYGIAEEFIKPPTNLGCRNGWLR